MSPVDSDFADAISNAADELIASISTVGWPVEDVLQEMAGLAADIDNIFDLVERAAKRRFGTAAVDSDRVSRVAASIAEMEARLHAATPRLNDELRLRIGPIREQWEARGPGLLNEAAKLTEREFVPESFEVVLVAPYAGGRGFAHWPTNRILLEAVLVHAAPELPEPLRIAWLVCQLNGELPRYLDHLPLQDARKVIELAAVPAVLSAAETVDLAKCDGASVALALEAWEVGADAPSVDAQLLMQWWSAHMERRPRWPVALAALGRMINS